MPFSYTGEVAALGSAVCWATCSIAFTKAGKSIGSLCVCLLRLVMAGICLLGVTTVIYSRCVPDAPPQAWGYLVLSGVLGLFFGDLCLFKAFLMIGPRLCLLIMSLWPPIAALIAWPLLGEVLNLWQWLGMVITLFGIAVVVMERPQMGLQGKKHHYVTGVLLAFMGAAGQAAGYVISDIGMDIMDPTGSNPTEVSFMATQIRVLSSALCFAVVFTAWRRWPQVIRSLKHTKAMTWLAFGSISGAVLGVVLSMIAIRHTEAGVASTIMATAPVLILPYAILVDRERVKVPAILATIAAIGGVAILLLCKST